MPSRPGVSTRLSHCRFEAEAGSSGRFDDRTVSRYSRYVEYRAPTRTYAFVLAVVSGTLLATGHYVGGLVTGVAAVALLALWRFAERRGDDDRFTIW